MASFECHTKNKESGVVGLSFSHFDTYYYQNFIFTVKRPRKMLLLMLKLGSSSEGREIQEEPSRP